MKLTIKSRAGSSKCEPKQIRRDRAIPAIVYSQGKEGNKISVGQKEFEAALRQLKKGHLPVTVFELVDEEGVSRKAIVKDIQYHPTTYAVLHLDFLQLFEEVPVNVRVPIELTGGADCVGVKLGGVVRQVIRYLKVRCLPNVIPAQFQIAIEDLNIKQSRRLAAIVMPEGVRPLADLNEVAVVIAKR